MEQLKTYLDIVEIGHAFGYIGTALLLFLVGKLWFNLIHRAVNVSKALFEDDNVAFSISYIGYLFGIVIIIGGTIIGDSHGFYEDIKLMIVYTLIGMLFLVLSVGLCNKLILSKFDLTKEVLGDQNKGAGTIEFAMYIGTALILFGALVGESESLSEGLKTFAAYWLLGMLSMIIITKIYTMAIDFNIHKEIEKDNVAAGISFAGVIIAISILLMHALSDPFTDWLTTILDVMYYTLTAIIVLPLMRFITDKLLVPGRTLTQEIVHQEHPNIGAAFIEVFSYISAAVLISWTF